MSIVAKLEKIKALDADWDGSGAAKPNAAAFDRAISFASSEAVTATALADGSALIVFRSIDGKETHLEFSDDGDVLLSCSQNWS